VFITEIAALKADGLITNFWQYWDLPEPVLTAWRIYAEERSKKIAQDNEEARARAKRR
jgi:hypothetical protein